MSRHRLKQINKARSESALVTAVEAQKLIAEGKTTSEAAEALGVSEKTIWRGMKRLTGVVNSQAPVVRQEYQDRQRALLEEMQQVTLNSEQYDDETRTKLLLRIHDRLARLLGTNAEQRSRLDVNVSHRLAQDMTSAQIFEQLIDGLDDARYQKAIDYILQLASEQREEEGPPLLAGEIVGQEEPALPRPHRSHHAEEE